MPPVLTIFDLSALGGAASRPCRPRILIVADGSLGFVAGRPFGPTRFIEGITLAAGVTNKPIITLAHRGGHATAVPIGIDSYPVKTGATGDHATGACPASGTCGNGRPCPWAWRPCPPPSPASTRWSIRASAGQDPEVPGQRSKAA